MLVMGFIVNDEVRTAMGLDISGLIATIHGRLEVEKREGVYYVTAYCRFYKDSTTNAPVHVVNVNHPIDDPSGNLFDLVYSNLKSKYKDTVDM